MRRRGVGFIGSVLAVLLVSAPAAASPSIHAHRGGSLETVRGVQRPAHPESSMPAFRSAAKAGFVLELDVRRTADGVPVVIHDVTLDRTTDCEGPVLGRTAAQIASCEIDLLGTNDVTKELREGDPRRTHVPRLAAVMRLVRRTRAEVNLEIKNVPIDSDYDVTDGFARRVAAVVRASGLPPSRLIVQSFWPPSLLIIESDSYFDAAATSLLTQPELNLGGPVAAKAAGVEWVSPAWPVDTAYVSLAHALGLRVVPYTLDDRAHITAAARIGVDALITNDPRLARRALTRAPGASPPGVGAGPEGRAAQPIIESSCGRSVPGCT